MSTRNLLFSDSPFVRRLRIWKSQQKIKTADENELTTEEIFEMFNSEEDNQITRSNRNRLALLLLFGYKIEYRQKKDDIEKVKENSTGRMKSGQERINMRLNQERQIKKIVIFNFCEIGNRKIFFKVLGYFNDLKITGNMNHEKVYY